jgi:hypothetical protein
MLLLLLLLYTVDSWWALVNCILENVPHLSRTVSVLLAKKMITLTCHLSLTKKALQTQFNQNRIIIVQTVPECVLHPFNL